MCRMALTFSNMMPIGRRTKSYTSERKLKFLEKEVMMKETKMTVTTAKTMRTNKKKRPLRSRTRAMLTW